MKKALSISIGFILIDLIMLIIFISTKFSEWNLIFMGSAIFAEIAIIGGIIIYDINKKE